MVWRSWRATTWTGAPGAGGGQPCGIPRSGQRRRPDVTIEFVDVQRRRAVGPLGAKGVGEIGQVGTAAAIANAVFHATGRRIRELPMTPELVMDPVR